MFFIIAIRAVIVRKLTLPWLTAFLLTKEGRHLFCSFPQISTLSSTDCYMHSPFYFLAHKLRRIVGWNSLCETQQMIECVEFCPSTQPTKLFAPLRHQSPTAGNPPCNFSPPAVPARLPYGKPLTRLCVRLIANKYFFDKDSQGVNFHD